METAKFKKYIDFDSEDIGNLIKSLKTEKDHFCSSVTDLKEFIPDRSVEAILTVEKIGEVFSAIPLGTAVTIRLPFFYASGQDVDMGDFFTKKGLKLGEVYGSSSRDKRSLPCEKRILEADLVIYKNSKEKIYVCGKLFGSDWRASVREGTVKIAEIQKNNYNNVPNKEFESILPAYEQDNPWFSVKSLEHIIPQMKIGAQKFLSKWDDKAKMEIDICISGGGLFVTAPRQSALALGLISPIGLINLYGNNRNIIHKPNPIRAALQIAFGGAGPGVKLGKDREAFGFNDPELVAWVVQANLGLGKDLSR